MYLFCTARERTDFDRKTSKSAVDYFNLLSVICSCQHDIPWGHLIGNIMLYELTWIQIIILL